MCQRIASQPDALKENHRGLVERIAARDQTALGDLYAETNSMAYSIAYGILSDREAAEEAVQDAYLQIWRTAQTFDPQRGCPLAWIVTIVRCRSLDRRRKLVRERREDSHDQEWPAASGDPHQVSFRAEARRLVRSALNQLRTEQRTLIEHAYYRGMSHREMAAKLEIPLGTIKTRIRSAMRQLRRTLGPYEPAGLLE